MCTLTTQHGIKWEILSLNGRVAYQRDTLTVLWIPSQQSYIVLDALCAPIMRGTLEECLESVRYDLN